MPKNELPQPEKQPEAQASMVLSEEMLTRLVREMRRPDPEHEAKMKAEHEYRKKQAARRVRIAQADEQAKRQREKNCGHRKPNGEASTGFARYSNGRIQEMCLRCQKVVKEFWAPEVAQGMALQKKLEKLGMTQADLDITPEEFEEVGVGRELPREPWSPDLTTEHH